MKKNILLLLLWASLFFVILGWKPSFAYNAQRYFEIFLLGCLLCVGTSLSVRLRLSRRWLSACLLLLCLVLMVVLNSGNAWLAWREALMYLTLFASVVVVAKAREQAGELPFDRAASLGILCFCAGCSLMVLEGLAVSLSIHDLNHSIIFGAFINVRFFAELQFLTLFLMPAIFSLQTSAKGRCWVQLVAFIGWGLLLFSGTRSALIIIPFALLVLWLVAAKKAAVWLKLLGQQLVGGLLVFLLLRASTGWYLHSSLEDTGEGMGLVRSGSSGRIGLWSDAWSHFLQQPWLGNGPGTFACFTDRLEAHPHNLFLLLLSEWGLLVTLMATLMLLMLFVVLVKHLREANNPPLLDFSLFVTAVVVVAASMMEGMLLNPLQQLLLVLMLGWTWHVFGRKSFVVTLDENSEVTTSLYAKRRSLLSRIIGMGFGKVIALLLVVLMVVALWAIKQDIALQHRLLVSPDGRVRLSYGPRYWADGHDHCPAWHQRHQERANLVHE